MGYREQQWSQRVGTLGDIAEGVFEDVAPFGSSIRFGLNRPPFKVGKLTPEQRSAPDYLSGTGFFVEVQGCGRDNILKVKLEKWNALKAWNKHIGEVRFFFWNGNLSEWVAMSWDAVSKLVTKAKRTDGVQEFNDGNEYVGIHWDWIDGAFPYAK